MQSINSILITLTMTKMSHFNHKTKFTEQKKHVLVTTEINVLYRSSQLLSTDLEGVFCCEK